MRKQTWVYNHERPGLGDTDEPDPHQKADAYWSLRIGSAIDRHFPGYPWKIRAETDQGMLYISIPVITGGHGMKLKLKALQHDIHDKLAIEAAAHILERWRVPRSALLDYDLLRTAPRLYGPKSRPPA